MRFLRVLLLVCVPVTFAATRGAAQTLYMGNSPLSYETQSPPPIDPDAGVQTFVDLFQPASATGTIVTAGFNWFPAPCPAAAKLKVFRRRGETLVFVAERGPFDALQDEFQNRTTVTLEPPIDVQQGDLIGISRLSDCGSPRVALDLAAGGPHYERPTEGLARFDGDLAEDVPFSSGQIEALNQKLTVSASGPATELVASVLPVAGSTPGAFGSYFRTGIQLSNLGSMAISGRLVFHAAGAASSPDDPSLPFTIYPVSTFSHNDVVAAMGQAGLGTLDVVVGALSVVPLTTARVYADSGDGGTFGFTEEAAGSCCLGFRMILSIGSTSYLVAPSDLTHFRYNIGVRALFKAPTLRFRVVGPGGTLVREVTKTYPPGNFVQQPSDAFFGGPIPPSALIVIDVTAGTAIVYGATVDNMTNDPSIQFASGF